MRGLFLRVAFGSILIFCCAHFDRVWAAPATIEITFLTWRPNQPDVWQELIDGFHASHPHITVKRQVAPHSSTEYHAIIAQRLKNRDTSMDVFLMDVVWPPEFANAGWALDLSSQFSPEDQKAFLAGPISSATFQGKVYGVPSYMAAGLLYYRKDLLEKHHFDPPATWREMIAQGNMILKETPGSGLNVYSGQFKQYEGLICNMLEFIRSNGGAILDSQTGEIFLDQPPALQAMTFVRDRIIGKAAPRGVVTYEEPESLSLFTEGKAVFHRNWPYAWPIANDPEKSKISGRVGVAVLPAFKGHDPAATLGGWHFGINAFSQHKEASWQFIRFMTSKDSQKILALKAGLAPTRKAVYEDPDIKEKMPHLIAFLPSFKRAVNRPPSPLYPMVSQELQRFFSTVITEKNAPLEPLARAAVERLKRLMALQEKLIK